jgi:hypothetical protein
MNVGRKKGQTSVVGQSKNDTFLIEYWASRKARRREGAAYLSYYKDMVQPFD